MSKSKIVQPNLLSEQTQSELIAVARKALLSGMSYDEIQAKIVRHATRLTVNENIEEEIVANRSKLIRNRLPRPVRAVALVVPLLLLVSGLYLVGSAVVPILGYYVGDDAGLQTELTAPIPRYQVMDVTPLVIVPSDIDSSESDDQLSEPEVVEEVLDYTNLANWFTSITPELATMSADQAGLNDYQISIPSLNIENAQVRVGGTDLEESLIAYPGTALPGEFGAPVIFGHSVLRQFYNPSEKNPRRYNSIFSTIMTLKEGKDKILVQADGITYTYLVQQKTEVKPEDVYILTQQYDARRLKLVTCVPEGTYLRRGVVTAQLIDTNAD